MTGSLNRVASRTKYVWIQSTPNTATKFTRRGRTLEQLEPRLLLAGDLVAQWLANDLQSDDGAAVTEWTDSIGGKTSTVMGTPTLQQNSIGGRATVRFDSSDGTELIRVNRGDNPLSGADDFTVVVVFSTESNQSELTDGQWFDHAGIVDSSTGGFSTGWGISMNSQGQVAAGMGAGFGKTSSTVYSTQQGLNDGESHVAIFTRSGTTISLYVDNGTASSTNDASSASRATTIDLAFGAIQSSITAPAFTGDIAEVRFYNGFMTSAEAASLYDDVQSFYQNEAPVAFDDNYSTPEDPLLFVIPPANGVLANDMDAESDPLTATLIESTRHGMISLNANGSFVYSPVNDFFGTDSFTYAANDFRPGEPATVTIEVTPVYDPATAVTDTYKVLSNQVTSIDALVGVLANDTNPDRATLNAVLESDVEAGELSLNANGSFTYNPGAFAGTTSFSYRIDDGTRLSSPQTVTLNVNTPPVANNIRFELTEDTELVRTAANGVASNDRDAENDPLIVSVVSEPTNGTLQLNFDGSFRYVPDLDFSGEDSFTYQLTDWLDTSNVATVQLSVQSVNDSPVARADTFFGGSTISTPLSSGVLANDTDVDSSALAVQLVSGPSNGTLDLKADGAFSYTADDGFSGVDSFSYRVGDSNSFSETVEARLYVNISPIRITEIMTANLSSLATRTRASVDEAFSGEESHEDWIEIQNVTDADLDVGGLHLTDSQNAPFKWAFPVGTIVPASGYLTVFASRLNIVDVSLDETERLHTNFTLQVEGEYLAVTSPKGVTLQEFDYPHQVPDVSFGFGQDGTPLYFQTATPGAANDATFDGVVPDTTFSAERGFYSQPFTVAIQNEMPNVQIRYTTDGSAPSAENGMVYSDVVRVTTTTNLRAVAILDGFLPSKVTTHSYVFLSDVANQGNSPEGYPDMFGLGAPNTPPWDPRPADYEVDPEVTQDPKYKDIFDDALLAIPTISIVTSVANLFDTETGIYQNTDNHGEEWERPASIEMILPDGSTAFQIDAGIRIQGGASREPWKNPKHGFRLKFKGKYGADDLVYDWFGGDSVTKFDEIVLRAGANQAWTHHNNFEGDNRGRAQYVRDQWAADTYLAMGNPAPHTDYAHVYINGLYWGLYNPKERPTADFAASYLGGIGQDYDVVNAGELLSGNLDSWRVLNSRDFRDLEDDATYQAFSKLLDIDSYIDYMVMNHYGGNIDWDSHNWYAVSNRNGDGKFYFVPWDEEFIFIRNNDNKINSREAQPGRLFSQLQTNDEFKMLLADRIQQHMFNDGLLTPSSVVERWNARSDQITDAIIGESARWGDFRRDVDRQGIAGPFELLERDVQWMAERERLLNDYFPARTEIVVQQYRNAGLFPETAAPLFNIRGGRISTSDPIELSTTVGTIYYTIDGTDPRLAGGELNPNAIAYTGEFTLNQPATVRARVLNDVEWSPIDEASFIVGALTASSSNLRVSEINFNPGEANEPELRAGLGDNNNFEFLELLNIANQRVDLTNVQFVQTGDNNEGIGFAFPAGMVLEPGERLVVVEDESAFTFRYGDRVTIAGEWTGQLSNGGEQITLMIGDEIIQQFTYDDKWYPETDGDGFTLESVDPTASDLDLWSLKDGWQVSHLNAGSPGVGSTIAGDSNHDGRFDSADLVRVFIAAEYEDGIANNSTFEEGDWNGDGEFDSSDLVFAFQAGTYVAAAQSEFSVPLSFFDDGDRKIAPLNRVNHLLVIDELFAANDQQSIGRVTS